MQEQALPKKPVRLPGMTNAAKSLGINHEDKINKTLLSMSMNQSVFHHVVEVINKLGTR